MRGAKDDKRQRRRVPFEVEPVRDPADVHLANTGRSAAQKAQRFSRRHHVQRIDAERPPRASLGDDEAVGRPGQPRHDDRRPSGIHFAERETQRRRDRIVRRAGIDRLDEHFDRSRAGHPNGPRILVT